MKFCPECRKIYPDASLNFCVEDGASLQNDPQQQQQHSQTKSPETPAARSIAVLPFVNMSADAENEYFCEGLSEELLNALAQIRELKVAARTSSFSFKDKQLNVGEIGRILNVGSILEGSVRKSGNKLRITAQLIDASDGYHLWSEKYDREVTDIFGVQDEITRAIVDVLRIKLLGEKKPVAKPKPAARNHTANAEAVELYWKGLYFYHKYTVEAWKKSISYYEKAIAKQPDFAPAHAGLALCLSGLAYFNVLNPHEIIPKARASVERALQLDANSADAHFTLANIKFYYEWNWEDAEREFRRAIELNANNAVARIYYGTFLFSRKRFAEAVREGEAALARDPLSLMINLHAGWIYLAAHDYEKAFGQVKKLIDLDPHFYGAYWLLGTIRQTEELFEESARALEKSLSLGGDQLVLSTLGLTHALAGRREEALKIAAQLLEMKKTGYVSAFNLARIFIGLEEDEKTLFWLEKAFQEQSGELVFIEAIFKMKSGEVYGKNLRLNPQFQYLLRRINITL